MKEPRLVVIATWRCSLRCRYCLVPFSPSNASLDILRRCADFLLASQSSKVRLHFHGGEPLLIPFERLRAAVLYSERKAERLGKEVGFIVTTNGLALDKRRIALLKKHRFFVELSVDGDPQGQDADRVLADGSGSSDRVFKNLPRLLDSGVDCMACMVVSPGNVGRLARNFSYLVKAGFRKLALMPACGVMWKDSDLADLHRELAKLKDLWFLLASGGRAEIRNLQDGPSPFRINTELTADTDGALMWGCLTYLNDSRRPAGAVLGTVFNPETGIDALLERRLPNEEAIRVFYTGLGLEACLESNRAAGGAINDAAAFVKKRLESEVRHADEPAGRK